MKTIIFLFHPDIKQSRINQSLIGHPGVDVRDEYALYPHGDIDVLAEQAVLKNTDRVVWQFPLYWYSSPSLLKKWEDQVLTYGWAYGPHGDALHGKELQLTVTIGGQEADYQPGRRQGHTIEEYLFPFAQTGKYTGMKVLKPFVVFDTFNISDADLAKAAAKYRQVLKN